jgi:predicted amidophosphoribosyltransferase
MSKTCPSCLNQMDYLATRCPHCTSHYQTPTPVFKTETEIFIIVCIVIVTVIYSIFK